jgi:hypothetical protein
MTDRTVRYVEYPADIFPPGFHDLLGKFHAMWLMFDPTLDYSIGHFLRTPTRDTHMLVSGMMFGTKLRLLADLIKRCDHPRKDRLAEAIKTLQASKRDQITHAYIKSNSANITFMYRSKGGSYQAGELAFHINDFIDHVGRMVEATIAYQKALGASDEELIAFANAIESE